MNGEDNKKFNYNILGFNEYDGIPLLINNENQIKDIFVDHQTKTIYVLIDNYWLKISNCCEKFKLDSSYNLNKNDKNKYYVLITPNNQRVGIISVNSVKNKLFNKYFKDYLKKYI